MAFMLIQLLKGSCNGDEVQPFSSHLRPPRRVANLRDSLEGDTNSSTAPLFSQTPPITPPSALLLGSRLSPSAPPLPGALSPSAPVSPTYTSNDGSRRQRRHTLQHFSMSTRSPQTPRTPGLELPSNRASTTNL
jgi:hypothetical protein